MVKKLIPVLGFLAALVFATLTAPAPAAALPAPPPCFVGGPGSSCAGQVTFSSYALSTVFRPFQGVSGNGQQPDIQISFNHLVHNVRAFANDPDAAGSTASVHLYIAGWVQFQTINGDGDPATFTVGGGGGIQGSSDGFDAVRLHSASGDYVNWRVEYQLNADPNGQWCKISAQSQTCQTVTATISPFAQGSIFDPFQAVAGTGVQPPIDITFQYPVAQVALTALDPDYGGNRMEAYAADGTLLGTAYFDGDNFPGYSTWSTKSLAVANISRLRVISADNDYTVFQGLTIWPMNPLPLQVSINGPGSISAKGTYTFSASYSNFSPNPTFNWSERFCDDSGCPAWVAIGTSSSFNRVLSPDCSGSGNNTYQTELTMQNADGRTATADYTTYLCNLQ